MAFKNTFSTHTHADKYICGLTTIYNNLVLWHDEFIIDIAFLDFLSDISYKPW